MGLIWGRLVGVLSVSKVPGRYTSGCWPGGAAGGEWWLYPLQAGALDIRCTNRTAPRRLDRVDGSSLLHLPCNGSASCFWEHQAIYRSIRPQSNFSRRARGPRCCCCLGRATYAVSWPLRSRTMRLALGPPSSVFTWGRIRTGLSQPTNSRSSVKEECSE